MLSFGTYSFWACHYPISIYLLKNKNRSLRNRCKVWPNGTPSYNERFGTRYLKWTKLNLWKTAFKKFEVIWSASLQIFQRLSSTNFVPFKHLTIFRFIITVLFSWEIKKCQFHDDSTYDLLATHAWWISK